MNHLGVKTYKISIYHPSSNLAERMLREVERILRTYYHDNHLKWGDYIEKAEEFINISQHDSTGITPYEALFRGRSPRVIEDMINFDWFRMATKDIRVIM